ncbi:hypothetical protein [Sinorhizobium meliloti]|uniref:hypothetical protein n=1 Tax=Rhizobium meliloti TaxID=382 RepID=UPI000FD72C1B|nr:hypothetical protein [Sinorhizobium meliloti]RVG77997.1 hypothetical protein CN219_29080 [Sinorhizobium meliloti]RVI32112.1 hypothetical protein CN197_19915 [Sinorhizobium meliloti]RVI43973.1 hypothetical protein CN196_17245 [Sinorhizobium meliloti]RVJ18827.1 hypothetical protein CN177_26685 [Sinorhizobium meliloti]RVJ92639.1 hypothetical protein CN170_25840 [Sinorhizobium meliloti]
MSEIPLEAIGGWLKDEDSRLDRTFRRLGDIPTDTLNREYIAYFEDYRHRYFNDRLLPGQGVEEILQALRQHGGTPRRWIDLSAGVTTLFWSIGVNRPDAVCACDLVPEALHVLAAFKAGSELPQCYRDALAITGKSESEFNRTRSMHWDFHVMDCLKPWTSPTERSGYDLITAIGCFGLARGPKDYEEAFAAAAKQLAPGGRLIGVDWIRSQTFIEKEGHDNSYLSSALTARCAWRAALTLLEASPVAIADDPYYDSLIVWAYGRGE